jgi:CRISPR-associated protein Csm5
MLTGSGEQLTPIDYMVWQNEVRVLDQERIFKLLARNPRLESYLDQLRKSERLDWAQWGGYAQNYSSARIPFASAGLSSIWEKARNEDLYIPVFARGGGRRILPGSALKGAFRTAFLMGAVSEEKRAAVWTECASAGSRSKSAAVLESAMDGRRKLDTLGFADVRIPADSFRIYQSRVLVLRSAETKPGAAKASPAEWKPGQQFVEMAKPGTVMEGRGVVPGPVIESIRVQVRRWLDVHMAFARHSALAPLQETVQMLISEEAKLSGQACLLPLGWGAGFASKALLPDLTTPESRMLFQAMPGMRRGFAVGLPFPKTRRVALDGAGGAALCGWVRVELQ